MTTTEHSKPWDFSHVIGLVNALSPVSTEAKQAPAPILKQTTTINNEEEEQEGVSLGDFARVWQFLGVPPVVAESESTKKVVKEEFANKDDYASDGAVRYGLRARTPKTVTWRDDTSLDEAAPGSSPERDTPLAEQKLSKSQRKKKNRKERKAKEAPWTVSESEADNVAVQTPARKASLHEQTRYNLRSQHNNGKVSSAPVTSVRQASQPELPTVKEIPVAKEVPKATHWPVTPQSKRFLPASVQPRSKVSIFPTDTTDAVRAVQAAQAQLSTQTPTRTLPSRTPVIEPKIVRSGEDRHWALLLKLINEFQQDRRYLVAPMNMTTHNNDPSGIHLFVDASNIFIGFNDQLKRSRNIPLQARVPQVDLSFDALALLMERRRPIAKRTLVGSTPHLAAFDKAKSVGYECSILEKVYKARELTERQIYFRDRDTRKVRRDDGYSSGGTSEAQYAPAKMIEQGVDELLHMKMAQSLLDFETPATMVVATGDAAQAEYSDGFKAMIERALRKGWTVELVSWSKNISSLYLRKEFRDLWSDRFRVVYLDDYAEELLDM